MTAHRMTIGQLAGHRAERREGALRVRTAARARRCPELLRDLAHALRRCGGRVEWPHLSHVPADLLNGHASSPGEVVPGGIRITRGPGRDRQRALEADRIAQRG